ncbi:Mog1p/PsbP-like protein [Pseudovirgaria hyperparasitica]|uniref:Mog1p/PsbP-like protein n=1 Tax=Pseudovirgaria hyperparasitica TaxID=470096 RepID=A0A6A6W5V3_9PEZI|nr:Mog1p/PsbP-like protein [Pseudovirgaria hyperparasitica]KAF2758262.1 Mog1p/PsbP-like protein [Pseudovirgaria hyperparasitica]
MATYSKTDLYGGAITADLPSTYVDVSSFRQVPDHQEVYVDKDGLTSVIFEILNYVGPEIAATDEDALKYHFEDIAEGTNDTTKYLIAASAKLSKLPTTPVYLLAATQTPAPAEPSPFGKPPKPQPDFYGILLILVRLPQKKTDIVVTINVPHVPGEYVKEDVDLQAQRLGPLMETAMEMRGKVLESFEIREWGLFGEE